MQQQQLPIYNNYIKCVRGEYIQRTDVVNNRNNLNPSEKAKQYLNLVNHYFNTLVEILDRNHVSKIQPSKNGNSKILHDQASETSETLELLFKHVNMLCKNGYFTRIEFEGLFECGRYERYHMTY